MTILNPEELEGWIKIRAYVRAKQSLLSWNKEVENEDWNNPSELKAKYGNASILKGRRVVFNISGNNFRLITEIDYKHKLVVLVWFGTHKEYDQIDADTV